MDTEPIQGPALPRAPAALRLALAPVPLPPLSVALTQIARRVVRTHPGLIERLGEEGRCRFLLDTTDLPFVMVLDVTSPVPRIRALRRRLVPECDATIAGPMSAFLGMMHGEIDGDALFFSRDISVDGDTSAVLALRNAIDDAELDLPALLAGEGVGRNALGALFAQAQRVTGLPLRRHEMTEDWS